ncbi:MAG: hypothetical protein AAF289_11685 [Cyanobacteria bacterium P01_A01_bin.135]
MVLNLSAAILSRLFPEDDPTQRALQWWHQRQIGRLHDSAELIRDGILQDLFAIRRMLELTHDTQAPVSPVHLQQLEALHARLEQVSNELSPAFIQDSLPLAIQHRLTVWQQQQPNVTAKLSLQPFSGSSLAHRLVLTALEELLTLVAEALEQETGHETDQSAEITIDTTLQRQEQAASLSITLSGLAPDQCHRVAQMPSLSHLKTSFEYLTRGSFSQTNQATQIRWQLCWPIEGELPPE